MKIIFATTNPHKILEIRQLNLPSHISIIGLPELGHTEDLPETAGNIPGNAVQKAHYTFDKYGEPCFAEDTGLEVFSLGNAPGVHSARYAGVSKDPLANMEKLLQQLANHKDRKAQFRTVIAWYDGVTTHTFTGIVQGRIAHALQGDGGFGYDPIFKPDGFAQSFAQLDGQIKNRISHRAQAWKKFADFLESVRKN